MPHTSAYFWLISVQILFFGGDFSNHYPFKNQSTRVTFSYSCIKQFWVKSKETVWAPMLKLIINFHFSTDLGPVQTSQPGGFCSALLCSSDTGATAHPVLRGPAKQGSMTTTTMFTDHPRWSNTYRKNWSFPLPGGAAVEHDREVLQV